MVWFRVSHRKVSAALLVLCLSCSGGDEISERPDSGLRQAPSFAELYETVFVPGLCGSSPCHGEETQGGRLDLRTSAIAFEQLVNVKAEGPQCVSTDATRVVPGQPDESLLYTKLFMDEFPCGRLMPPTALIIPDEHLKMVSDWIEAGSNWAAVEF